MSECLCLHREPRIESGWRSGSFTRDRSGRTRCSHQPMCSWIFNGWNEKKKKKSVERIYCHCWLANVRRNDLSRFELIRVVFFIWLYDNFQRPPVSIRSMDSDTNSGLDFQLLFSRDAKKKKKKNAISQSVFTLIGRSVDTIVNEDSHESPCSPCRS